MDRVEPPELAAMKQPMRPVAEEVGDEQAQQQRDGGVEHDPLEVVDQCSGRREHVQVEELLVGREQRFVVVEPDPPRDFQPRVRVAEAVDDCEDHGVDDEYPEHKEGRQEEHQRLPARATEEAGQPPSPGPSDRSGDGGATHAGYCAAKAFSAAAW